MPGGDALNLGPFAGGLNNVNNPAQIADDECQELINFEVDTDGSLRSRPAIQEMVAPTGLASRTKVIAHGILNVVGTDKGFVFASGSSGMWYIRHDQNAWTRVAGGGTVGLEDDGENMDDGVQYGGYMHFPKDPGQIPLAAGGRWSHSGGWEILNNMPVGRTITAYKDRLWVAYGDGPLQATSSRLYVSNLGGGWPAAPDFYDINPGDGQNVIDLAVVDDALVIFKQDSTYVLGYDANVSDAIIRQISPTIGATRLNCVVQHGNDTYVYHDDDVYQLVDFQYVKINEKVKFDVGSGTTPLDSHYITLLGDRLIVRRQNKMFAFNLVTRTWSEFESADSDNNTIGPMKPMPLPDDLEDRMQYFVGASSQQLNVKMFKWWDDVYGSIREQSGVAGPVDVDIQCSMQTKNFSFEIFHTFKRLFWWGAEIFTGQSTNGQGDVTAVGYNTESTSFSTTGNGRYFIKLKKGLRFRLINFKLTLHTFGQYYVRVFYAVPILKAPKQTVSKQVVN